MDDSGPEASVPLTRYRIPREVWLRIDQCELQKDALASRDIVWTCAVLMKVPIGWNYDHQTGTFVNPRTTLMKTGGLNALAVPVTVSPVKHSPPTPRPKE